MKTLDSYLLREMSAPFLIGLSAFLTVLCLNMAYFVMDLVINKEAPLDEVIRIIALRVPFYLVLAMPVAVLLASSLATNRITRDRELIALRLAGVSLWRLLAPFAVVGALLSGGSFAAQEWAAPKATHQSDNLYRQLYVESNVPSLTPDTFFPAGNRIFYFHRAYRSGKRKMQLEGVMLYQLNGTPFPEIWSAREASVEGDVWTMKGVVMHHLDDHGQASVDGRPVTGEMVLDLHQDMSLMLNSAKMSEEMTASELRAQIRDYSRMGVRGIPLEKLQYDLYSKYSIPVACLICALIGIPLNIRFARLGGFIGLFLALVAVFVYYNGMLVARSLSYSGSISPLLGAWLPDIVFATVCLALICREI